MQPKSPQNLTQARLKELLHYDPETGVFKWLVHLGTSRVGGVAGSLRHDGYLTVMLDHKRYATHRLAFIYMLGGFPEYDVDHINGVRDDNRWVNLRAVSCSENNQNLGEAQLNNQSGFLGVGFNKRTGNYYARICTNYKQKHIGCFPTPELAHAAYLEAKGNLHPTHQRLRVAR